MFGIKPGKEFDMIQNKNVLTTGSFAAMFFLGVGTAILGAASRNIGLTPSQIGLMLSIQNVGFIISVVAVGSLADTTDKAKLMFAASLVIAISFTFFYLWGSFPLNLFIMLVIGIGIGGYEGSADPLLLDLYTRRQSLFISINHFFVTFGELMITAYLIFLQMDWREALVQSAAAVLILAVLFGLARVPKEQAVTETLHNRFTFLRKQRSVLVLFLLAACAVGIELALIGMITSFLMEFHGFDQVTSKLGLVAFLVGVAAGRLVLGFLARTHQILGYILALFALLVVFLILLLFLPIEPLMTYLLLFLSGATISVIFPLIITLTGLKYPQLSGTALGVIKLGIPAGGILVPLLVSLVAGAISFQASLALFPLIALGGFILALSNRRLLAVVGEKG